LDTGGAVAAIFDEQSGRRYGQVQFLNQVVDYIRSDGGRRPCYDLLEALAAMQAGEEPRVRSVTLSEDPGVPLALQGLSFTLVEGETDAERSEREWLEARRTKPIVSAAAVAEVDLGPCEVCGGAVVAGEEYVSVIEISSDRRITKVSNQHATCPAGSEPRPGWPSPRYLKPQEAAERLRVDPRTIKRWLQQGKLSGFKTPGGQWRVLSDLIREIEGAEQPGQTGDE
jgi:excisionase family DNA binding protein